MYRFLEPFMEEPDDKGGNVDELENIEIIDDKPEDKPNEKPEEKDDRVPLATLMEEKRKRKELERQLRELKEKEVDSDVKLTKTQLKQKYIEKGFDEDLAESLADEIASLKAEVKKSSFKELDNSTFKDDLKELARDSFYSDALTYEKEIQAVVSQYKVKGIDLDLEDAYMKVRGKARVKEIRTEIEQKALLDRQKGEDKKLPASTPKAPKDPYPLDETDKKALEGLQKAQPDAGWTAEKYYKTMKG